MNGKIWVGVVATVVTAIIVTTALTAVGMPAEVTRNTADIARHELEIRELRKAVGDMKGDIQYVRAWVDDQREKER